MRTVLNNQKKKKKAVRISVTNKKFLVKSKILWFSVLTFKKLGNPFFMFFKQKANKTNKS